MDKIGATKHDMEQLNLMLDELVGLPHDALIEEALAEFGSLDAAMKAVERVYSRLQETSDQGPIDQIIADALDDAGIQYMRPDRGVDFYIASMDAFIEISPFRSDRISKQNAAADNVIAIQGRMAAEAFAKMVRLGAGTNSNDR